MRVLPLAAQKTSLELFVKIYPQKYGSDPAGWLVHRLKRAPIVTSSGRFLRTEHLGGKKMGIIH